MASCMECTHFNPCNSHGKIIVEKPTEGNDWGLHNNVENECKYFTPTADVVEVKHGEWIYHECVSSYEGAISGYSCSVCSAFVNEEVFESDEFHKEYCGNCGAKMKRSDTE